MHSRGWLAGTLTGPFRPHFSFCSWRQPCNLRVRSQEFSQKLETAVLPPESELPCPKVSRTKQTPELAAGGGPRGHGFMYVCPLQTCQGLPGIGRGARLRATQHICGKAGSPPRTPPAAPSPSPVALHRTGGATKVCPPGLLGQGHSAQVLQVWASRRYLPWPRNSLETGRHPSLTAGSQSRLQELSQGFQCPSRPPTVGEDTSMVQWPQGTKGFLAFCC